MRGFAHILLILVALTGIASGIYFVQTKTHLFSQASSKNNTTDSQDTTRTADNTDRLTPNLPSQQNTGNIFTSIFDRLKTRGNTAQNQSTPTPTPSKTPTPTLVYRPTSTPTPTNTPTPSPTPIPQPTCDINAQATPLDPNTNFDNPLTVQLTYSAHSFNSTYMTGAQWDFDGNNSWDTDMSQSNGSVSHTFPGNGSYNIKLQLKMSDGQMISICSKNVTVPMGIAVKLTGKVYGDDNCDDYMQSSEAGIPEAPVRIYMSRTNTYSNLQTDSNGNYSLTKVINSTDYLIAQPTTNSITGYTMHSSSRNPVVDYTLNENQRQITANLSLVPLGSVSLCQAW